MTAAISYFNQAIAKDPGYALAYSGLADVWGVLPVYGGIPSDYQALNEAYADGELLPADNPISRKISALAAKITGSNAAEPRRKRIFSVFS